MAEYEQQGTANEEPAQPFPADFTPEEVETAQWLHTFYDIVGEQLPPRYAQTLLGDPHLAAADDDFEERTLNAVFTRLKLARPIAPARPAQRWRERAHGLMQRMGRQMTLAVMALAMLLSYNALGTSAAFASVLQFVVGHGGTQAVRTYPTQLAASAYKTTAVDASLNFTPRWPGYLSHQYIFVKKEIIAGDWWTNGAMVALHYERTDALGAHALTILEFLPHNGMALQVVQDGSAQSVQIGAASGVFVKGHWVRHNQQVNWEPGQRAELIFGGTAANDPVVWVAADGLGDLTSSQIQSTLVGMASTLSPMNLGHGFYAHQNLSAIGAGLVEGVNQPFGNDIIALVPDRSNPDAPILFVHVGQADPDNT